MTAQPTAFTPTVQRHQGPHLALLAILYTVLFNIGLYPVTGMAGKPYWPGPWKPASVIVPYFQTHHTQVLTCLFLQFGAILCLGLFTAVAVSQIRFLGVRSVGPWIALFGGFLVVSDGFAGGLTTWTLLTPSSSKLHPSCWRCTISPTRSAVPDFRSQWVC